jgi:hypothetical protein
MENMRRKERIRKGRGDGEEREERRGRIGKREERNRIRKRNE